MRILGDDERDHSGIAVACGDIDGDGIDDVVIGAYGADPTGGSTSAGETYIIYGGVGATSLPSIIDLGAGDEDVRILGDDEYDCSGWALSCGNVNGDNYDDLIIGTFMTLPPGQKVGEAYIIYGSAGLMPTIDLSTGGEDVRILGDDLEDLAGYSVGCGDINGDGCKDIIIGAFMADQPGGRDDAGETYIIYGGTGTTSLPPIIDLDAGDEDVRILGDDLYDGSGYAVACGDINGGGLEDLIIGAPYSPTGETYVIFGEPSLDDEMFAVDAHCDCLYKVDIKVGTKTKIGDLNAGFDSPVSMAIDQINHKIYVVDNTTNELLTVNSVTGMATVVCGGLPIVQGLAINTVHVPAAHGVWPTGTLFGSREDLFVIDKSTCGQTTIGPIGPTGTEIVAGLTFRSDGVLFGAELLELGADDLLFTINTATGTGTAIGIIGPNFDRIGALEFDSHGVLWGSDINNAAPKIVSISQTNASILTEIPLSFSGGFTEPFSPQGLGLDLSPETIATLLKFMATVYGGNIEIEWATASEIDNAGFNIHRSLSEDGKYIRINEELIPAQGSEDAGTNYIYTDTDVVMGEIYYYQLESVDLAGNSTWHGPTSVTLSVTGVAEGPSTFIPDAFGLAQNYPNPFNEETDIRYQIPEISFVILKIYNLLGQEIVTLVDEIKGSGYHSVHWDGTDSVGQEVSSSIYLYRITAGNCSDTKRMVLLK